MTGPPGEPVVPRPVSVDNIEKIERLGKLREAGHLTDDEFLAQKTKLLGNDPRDAGTRWTKAPVTVMAVEATDHHDRDHELHHNTFTQPVGIGACEIETLIKYRDAAGGETFRPIVIRNVERDAEGHIYLRSYYNLRHMARTFRADRIECFADGDGVITSTRDFLLRTLKIDTALIPA